MLKFEVVSKQDLGHRRQDNSRKVLQILTQHEGRAIIFLYNYHWFIGEKAVIQTIQESFPVWANEGKAIVVVAPVNKLPIELEKDFTSIDLKLPKEEEISSLIEHACPTPEYMPRQGYLEKVVSASKGLTKREIQNVYNLSLVKEKAFNVKVINEYRSKAIKKSGLAEVLEPDITPNDVIGYNVAKDFVMSTINNPEAKGVLFIGPPGCGKTTLIKSFAYSSQKLTILVDTGKLFSKFQGETDKNVRALIDLAWSLGDSYFVFDEMEKQFSGVQGSGDLDSGVTSRAIGKFLEFFQNRPKGCYIGGTCNSFKGLPPEYLRAGRWDTAPIFIDLPSKKVRNQILDHYIKKFGLTKRQTKQKPNTDNWSGSEIETLCHNASMRNSTLMDASNFVLPLYNVMREDIEQLRNWAKGRTIPSEKMETIKKKETKRKLDL